MTSPPSTDSSEKEPSGPRRWRIVLPVVFVAAVLLLAPYALTANPQACAMCHQMRPYVRSWQASSHALAARDCLVCHVGPGFMSGFRYRMGFYREVYAYFTDGDLVPGAVTIPGVASCQKAGCHSLNRIVSTGGDLRISHRLHVEKAGVLCARCHPGAAHRGVRDELRIVPPVELCMSCHKDRMRDCAFCHVSTRSFPEGGSNKDGH